MWQHTINCGVSARERTRMRKQIRLWVWEFETEIQLNRMVYNGSVFINTEKNARVCYNFFLTFFSFVLLKLSAQRINKTELIVCVCFEVMRIKKTTVNILMFSFFSVRFFICSRSICTSVHNSVSQRTKEKTRRRKKKKERNCSFE